MRKSLRFKYNLTIKLHNIIIHFFYFLAETLRYNSFNRDINYKQVIYTCI